MTITQALEAHYAWVTGLQETHSSRIMVDTIDGVRVRIEPLFTTKRMEEANVFLGSERCLFAREVTTIPWTIYREFRVSYLVWVDRVSREAVRALLQETGIKGKVVRDPYAESARYHVGVRTLENVVTLYKALHRRRRRDDQ